MGAVRLSIFIAKVIVPTVSECLENPILRACTFHYAVMIFDHMGLKLSVNTPWLLIFT
jgi:hypothetical protein